MVLWATWRAGLRELFSPVCEHFGDGVSVGYCGAPSGVAHELGYVAEDHALVGGAQQGGIDFELEVDPALLRPTDERVILGDVTKLVRDTGWSPAIAYRDTIAEMLAYWREKLT